MKKTILLVIILLMAATGAKAQKAKYSHKSYLTEGCSMRFYVAKQNTSYFIVACMTSERLLFMKNPTMLLKTFDGDVLELSGNIISANSQSIGIISGNMVVPVSELHSSTQFEVTPEQFELIKKGISKIRISTVPVEHERTFKKDKIGKKIYNLYLKQKAKGNEF